MSEHSQREAKPAVHGWPTAILRLSCAASAGGAAAANAAARVRVRAVFAGVAGWSVGVGGGGDVEVLGQRVEQSVWEGQLS